MKENVGGVSSSSERWSDAPLLPEIKPDKVWGKLNMFLRMERSYLNPAAVCLV